MARQAGFAPRANSDCQRCGRLIRTGDRVVKRKG
jgi:hypothetical protein